MKDRNLVEEFDKILLEGIRKTFGVYQSDAMRVAMDVRRISNHALEKIINQGVE